MKCEKCREKEAEVFCTITVNGQTARRRLCAGCADEEGFGEYFNRVRERVSESFFGISDSFFGDFFEPAGFLGSLRHLPFSALIPQAVETCERRPDALTKTVGADSDTGIPDDAGEAIRKRREISALRHRMKSAVREENFEKAAEIRDRIKEIDTDQR